MDGIINILKPPHMTSHDVVGFIRRKLKTKKVGHTGTLDPMAVGVLPICVGKATKISQYLLDDHKKYRCELTLGKNTDTQDKWGNVIREREVSVSKDDIIQVIQSFQGEISQTPPMYSALKVQGKKLYELAREGKIIERESRKINIYDIDILQVGEHTTLFDVLCSKGTYVRTLCEDIGDKLGCGGFMSFLERIQSGRFTIDTAITLEALEKASLEEIARNYLFSMDYPLSHFPRIDIKPSSEKYLLNGNNLFMKNIEKYEALHHQATVRLYSNGKFIALGKIVHNEDFYIDVGRVIL